MKKDPAIEGNPYPRQSSRKAPGTIALHHLDLDAALSGFAALIHGLENDDMSTLFKLYWILLEGPAGGQLSINARAQFVDQISFATFCRAFKDYILITIDDLPGIM